MRWRADYRPARLSRRLWPHAEAAKAAAAQWRAGEPEAAELAALSLRALCGHFIGRPFTTGWIDHFDADGAPLVDYVPASSLYHLMMAGSEVARTFLLPAREEQEPGARIAPSDRRRRDG